MNNQLNTLNSPLLNSQGTQPLSQDNLADFTPDNSQYCNPYIFSIFDLIFPPYIILDQVCISKDKTLLFIISLIRLLIIWIVSIYINNYILIDIWIIINALCLLIIFTKIPLYDLQVDKPNKPNNVQIINDYTAIHNNVINI